ncbi:MAG: hypothetical protein KBC15_01770 [Candidatus Levybacteria bacterium]|nr:hypothetical protein [Candidatus Levybacteria bacterium]
MFQTAGELTIQDVSVAILAAIITLFCVCYLSKYTLFLAMLGYIAIISMIAGDIAEQFSQSSQTTALAILIAAFCFEILFIATPISKKKYDEVAKEAMEFRAIIAAHEARRQLDRKEAPIKYIQDLRVPHALNSEFWKLIEEEFRNLNIRITSTSVEKLGRTLTFANEVTPKTS